MIITILTSPPKLTLLLQQLNKDEAKRGQSIWLPDYKVDIEALELPDVADLSGLTFDPVRGTLFAITNANPEILEISRDGLIMRRIAVTGLVDPEAIEHVGGGSFILVDEPSQTLVATHLDNDIHQLDTSKSLRLTLGLGVNGNKGFEGLAWDKNRSRLIVAKERDPHGIYEVRGFPYASPHGIEIKDNKIRDALFPGTDISSLHFDLASGNLLVLSEESRLLVEFDTENRIVSSMSLTAGSSGLQKTIPQAEGVTMDGQGNLYVISEPNLFYRFTSKP